MRKSLFAEKPHWENKQFRKTKTWISNSHLNRQSFYGYCCKSGIAILVRRVTWNYAYSPFKWSETYLWITPWSVITARFSLSFPILAIAKLTAANTWTFGCGTIISNINNINTYGDMRYNEIADVFKTTRNYTFCEAWTFRVWIRDM